MLCGIRQRRPGRRSDRDTLLAQLSTKGSDAIESLFQRIHAVRSVGDQFRHERFRGLDFVCEPVLFEVLCLGGADFPI